MSKTSLGLAREWGYAKPDFLPHPDDGDDGGDDDDDDGAEGARRKCGKNGNRFRRPAGSYFAPAPPPARQMTSRTA